MLIVAAILALSGTVAGQAANEVDSRFGTAPGDPGWEERYRNRIGDGFGRCVIRHAPAEAQSFVEAATSGPVPAKSPALNGAVERCLAERGKRERTFLVRHQDTAIYRAVLRKQGKPLPS